MYILRRACWAWPAHLAGLLLLPITAEGAVPLPDGSTLDKVDFERHVQGLLGKLGCNAGACHGSFQGKGGLYLSLFSYSPEKDFSAFTRDGMGRRINRSDPDQSLLLLKPSGQLKHGGGLRFSKDSWQYQIIKEWIADGANWKAGSGTLRRLEVTPTELFFRNADKDGHNGQRVKVVAEFADGTQEDVTYLCDIKVTDDSVASVLPNGVLRALRPGETSVVISYRGHVRAIRALVPQVVPRDFVYPTVPEGNYIDREVVAKLRKLNIVPSELSSDSEFLRRVTIDTIGSLPSPQEVRAFLADKDPQKREKKIDELLAHPLHAALWATKYCDITGNNVLQLEQPTAKRSKMWHDWFRKRFQENVPYDKIAYGVLCATSVEGQPLVDWVKQQTTIDQQAQTGFDSDYAQRETLDLYWRRRTFPLDQMGEHTAAAFLGIRLGCAQCHKHPFDRWTQTDYNAYANIFAQVRFGPLSAAEVRSAALASADENNRAFAEAMDKVERDSIERRKAAEEAFKQDQEERIADAEAAVDREYAERRQEIEKGQGSAEQRAKALESLDREIAARKMEARAIVQRTGVRRKQTILARAERANAVARNAVLNKFPQQRTLLTIRQIHISNQDMQPMPHPETGAVLPPKALGGPEFAYDKGDAREQLFKWLVQPDNPYFARSFVNRVWAHYFGAGLVDPVDNFSVANPPSNEKLLDALAKDFVAHKYDIRRLERTILLSRTYQLSAVPNATNAHDRVSHSHALPRRMMAEVLVDVLNAATGYKQNFAADSPPRLPPEFPPDCKAIELAPSRVQSPNLSYVFNLFGRPPRTASCDCERATELTLPQTLYLMTDQDIFTKINNGRLKQLLADRKAEKISDEQIIEELFLATLCRFPTEKEKRKALEQLKKRKTPEAGFVDITWALVNTREFTLNH